MAENLKNETYKFEINKDVLQNWTKEEKFNLFQGIKTYGSHDIQRIKEYISTKSVKEIEVALEYYKQIALKHPIFEKQNQCEKPKKAPKPHVPLTKWANLLTENINFNDLHTETATAVRMIADLEDLPSPTCTNNINFREIYHQIANALEGKAVQPDKLTNAVLNKCIVETALASKAFMKTSSFKDIKNHIKLADKEINMFPRPTDDEELAVLRHLAAQRSYNPLKIPEHFLKPNCDDSDTDSDSETQN